MAWTVAIWGKHPSASDYLVSRGMPSDMRHIIQIIHRGVERISARLKTLDPDRNWRFWAVPRKNRLICGVLRSSRDSRSRRHPLVIALQGELRGLEQQWLLIQTACERTWSDMEGVASRTDQTSREFFQNLVSLSCPDFSAASSIYSPPGLPTTRRYGEELRSYIRNSGYARMINLELNQEELSHCEQVQIWQSCCNNVATTPPCSCFYGEYQKQLLLFYRPLAEIDAIYLLTGFSAQEHQERPSITSSGRVARQRT